MQLPIDQTINTAPPSFEELFEDEEAKVDQMLDHVFPDATPQPVPNVLSLLAHADELLRALDDEPKPAEPEPESPESHDSPASTLRFDGAAPSPAPPVRQPHGTPHNGVPPVRQDAVAPSPAPPARHVAPAVS